MLLHFFAGVKAILSKLGVKDIDSNLATAIRTTVVLIASWLLVLITGVIENIYKISFQTLLFLILSGFSTGVSWIFYFKAIKLGDVNKVAQLIKAVLF
ncbi:EamA family transporter [Miniphocaeibacter halophilus]|uniref:EamA family transporter n=1 Tax=Miniphocaeibacter halophilus TaxID=2931922 RepID=UPI001FB212C9|nr:EamA family transporter [Miniphocaeibacter halophilus]